MRWKVDSFTIALVGFIAGLLAGVPVAHLTRPTVPATPPPLSGPDLRLWHYETTVGPKGQAWFIADSTFLGADTRLKEKVAEDVAKEMGVAWPAPTADQAIW